MADVGVAGLPPGFDARLSSGLPPPHRGSFLLRPVPGRVHLLLLQDELGTAIAELEARIDVAFVRDPDPTTIDALRRIGLAVEGRVGRAVGPRAARRVGAVHIAGAGLAGACVARMLADHGVGVTVFDAGPPPADAAEPPRGSSNPWLLCRPHFAAGPDPLAELTRAGWQLRGIYGEALTPLRAFVMAPRQGKLADHHVRVRERWRGSPWLGDVPADTRTTVTDGYAQVAARLDGPRAIARLLDGLDVRWGTPAPGDHPTIHCTGAPPDGLDVPWAPLAGTVIRGGRRALGPGLAVAGGRYAVDVPAGIVVGATRHRSTVAAHDDPGVLGDDARSWFGIEIGAPSVVWTGVRAKLPDHLPAVGRWGDDAVSVGHGSKGSATAPIAAALVVAQWLGLPWPVPRRLALALAPDRPRLARG